MGRSPKYFKAWKHEPLVLESIPENLLREPIEYIFADHYRQRQVIAALDRLLLAVAFTPPLEAEAAADITLVHAYLADELLLHIADEDEDLFPILEQRCKGDVGIKEILDTLRQEHIEDFEMLPTLMSGLKNLLAAQPVAEGELFDACVARFVETQRRHIIWENNIVLPLARRSLDDDDVITIGRKMAARRSIEFPL